MRKLLKSRETRDLLGISRQTLYILDKEDKLKPVKRTSRSKYYDEEEVLEFMQLRNRTKKKTRKTIVYYRVSSSSQKSDLDSQLKYLESYVSANGIQVSEYINDIGSGINYKRPGLKKLIKMINSGEVDRVIIAYKDRLVRFGFDLIEYIAELNGTEIEVINLPSVSPQEELVDDLMTIIHVFSARLYGLRRYKRSDFLNEENNNGKKS